MTCTCGPNGLPRRGTHDCPATVNIPDDFTLAAHESHRTIGWDALDDALGTEDHSDTVVALAEILDEISRALLGYETDDYCELPVRVRDGVRPSAHGELSRLGHALEREAAVNRERERWRGVLSDQLAQINARFPRATAGGAYLLYRAVLEALGEPLPGEAAA